MNQAIPIHVESHSGYKADEYPKRFLLDDKWYEINEITDRWYQRNVDPEWPDSVYFKILTSEGGEFILKHETVNDRWFLIRLKEE